MPTEQTDALKRLWQLILDNQDVKHPSESDNNPNPSNQSGWIDGTKNSVGLGDELQTLQSNTSSALAGYSWDVFIFHLLNLTHVDHPDSLINRFLVARKLDANAAFEMIVNTIKFFDTEGLDAIKAQGESELPQYPLERGLTYYFGRDRDGNTVSYLNVKEHNPRKQTSKEFDRYILYEMMLGYTLLGEGRNTIVFDLTDFSLSNVEYHAVRYLFGILANNFPECLGRVIVCNAPWAFHGVWTVISGFLDPVVRDKVEFAATRDLPKWISEDQIPVSKGGSADYTYKYTPPTAEESCVLQDWAARDKLIRERQHLFYEFLQETDKWVRGVDNQAKRTRIADDLAYNYRRLAPYIWCSSILHRLGVIQNFDEVNFSKLLD